MINLEGLDEKDLEGLALDDEDEAMKYHTGSDWSFQMKL